MIYDVPEPAMSYEQSAEPSQEAVGSGYAPMPANQYEFAPVDVQPTH